MQVFPDDPLVSGLHAVQVYCPLDAQYAYQHWVSYPTRALYEDFTGTDVSSVVRAYGDGLLGQNAFPLSDFDIHVVVEGEDPEEGGFFVTVDPGDADWLAKTRAQLRDATGIDRPALFNDRGDEIRPDDIRQLVAFHAATYTAKPSESEEEVVEAAIGAHINHAMSPEQQMLVYRDALAVRVYKTNNAKKLGRLASKKRARKFARAVGRELGLESVLRAKYGGNAQEFYNRVGALISSNVRSALGVLKRNSVPVEGLRKTFVKDFDRAPFAEWIGCQRPAPQMSDSESSSGSDAEPLGDGISCEYETYSDLSDGDIGAPFKNLLKRSKFVTFKLERVAQETPVQDFAWTGSTTLEPGDIIHTVIHAAGKQKKNVQPPSTVIIDFQMKTRGANKADWVTVNTVELRLPASGKVPGTTFTVPLDDSLYRAVVSLRRSGAASLMVDVEGVYEFSVDPQGVKNKKQRNYPITWAQVREIRSDSVLRRQHSIPEFVFHGRLINTPPYPTRSGPGGRLIDYFPPNQPQLVENERAHTLRMQDEQGYEAFVKSHNDGVMYKANMINDARQAIWAINNGRDLQLDSLRNALEYDNEYETGGKIEEEIGATYVTPPLPPLPQDPTEEDVLRFAVMTTPAALRTVPPKATTRRMGPTPRRATVVRTAPAPIVVPTRAPVRVPAVRVTRVPVVPLRKIQRTARQTYELNTSLTRVMINDLLSHKGIFMLTEEDINDLSAVDVQIKDVRVLDAKVGTQDPEVYFKEKIEDHKFIHEEFSRLVGTILRAHFPDIAGTFKRNFESTYGEQEIDDVLTEIKRDVAVPLLADDAYLTGEMFGKLYKIVEYYERVPPRPLADEDEDEPAPPPPGASSFVPRGTVDVLLADAYATLDKINALYASTQNASVSLFDEPTQTRIKNLVEEARMRVNDTFRPLNSNPDSVTQQAYDLAQSSLRTGPAFSLTELHGILSGAVRAYADKLSRDADNMKTDTSPKQQRKFDDLNRKVDERATEFIDDTTYMIDLSQFDVAADKLLREIANVRAEKITRAITNISNRMTAALNKINELRPIFTDTGVLGPATRTAIQELVDRANEIRTSFETFTDPFPDDAIVTARKNLMKQCEDIAKDIQVAITKDIISVRRTILENRNTLAADIPEEGRRQIDANDVSIDAIIKEITANKELKLDQFNQLRQLFNESSRIINEARTPSSAAAASSASTPTAAPPASRTTKKGRKPSRTGARYTVDSLFSQLSEDAEEVADGAASFVAMSGDAIKHSFDQIMARAADTLDPRYFGAVFAPGRRYVVVVPDKSAWKAIRRSIKAKTMTYAQFLREHAFEVPDAFFVHSRNVEVKSLSGTRTVALRRTYDKSNDATTVQLTLSTGATFSGRLDTNVNKDGFVVHSVKLQGWRDF